MTDDTLYKSALTKAMNLCAGREYCSDDIRGKLSSWGISEKDKARIIETLIAENFINEMRYAGAFVKDRFRHNRWGRLKISSQLRAKRISQEVIDSALETLDKDEYRQVLEEMLSSHRKTVKAKNQYDLKGKLMRFGLSRGFESHLLYDILGEME